MIVYNTYDIHILWSSFAVDVVIDLVNAAWAGELVKKD